MLEQSSEISSRSLPHSERLRGRGAVAQLFVGGESNFSFPIRYVWCESDSECDSVLFTVPKRMHKRANRRNLLRRRMKEAYRLQKGLLARIATPDGGDASEGAPVAKGLNIALIYSSKEQLDYARVAKAVARALSAIAKESGRRGLTAPACEENQ